MRPARRHASPRGLLLLLAVLGLPWPATLNAAEPARQTVVAGVSYGAGGLHRVFWGSNYRALWTTPVAVEVLDLSREAGGLTPVRRVGGQQTKGLALRGRDGASYTFRGLAKDASSLLDLVDADLKGTLVEDLLDDQMSAQHPGSELVARGLLEAAGVPVPEWRLVVLPDDPALGEFQSDFTGVLGIFGEYPTPESEGRSGFRGATAIIDHLSLYAKLAADPGERVDALAFLRARLLDILMGDWDRHRKQWRWARFPGNDRWAPIPEDRDQAFSRYEGFVLALGRGRDGRLQDFGPRVASLPGLTYNGREQDRWLLAGLPRSAFADAAAELEARLTDEAIARAVDLLPPEWQALDAPRLAAALRARRDALPRLADRYYLHLAAQADVYLTDRPERVEATHQPNGGLELVAFPGEGDGDSGAPLYRRVFQPDETREVRLYTMGGDDRVAVTGGAGRITLRVVGGAGSDRLEATGGAGARLSDERGDNEARGPGARLDARTYEEPPRPKTAPWVPPRDFGAAGFGLPWVSWNSDLGVFLGAGLHREVYGFRKHPFAASHTVRAGWAFEAGAGRADYAALFPRENSRDVFGLNVYASGLETLRFYGFGNETGSEADDDFYKARESQQLLYGSYNWRFRGGRAAASLGPVLRYSENREGAPSLVAEETPYGFGRFGQAGLYAAFVADFRDHAQYPRRGFYAAGRANLWPKAWDADETYGSLGANLNGYLSAGRAVTLAVRLGGRRLFGRYPYRDAATLGGGGLHRGALQEPGFTLRGFRQNRFAGDGSVYANADLRLRLLRVNLIVPSRVGVFGLFDTGRVFLKGESSDLWHTSAGGGLWISFLNDRSTFSAYVAKSREESHLFHVGGGFTF